MFELRRLKMGERPVTGQGNKEAVEGFFQRQLNSAETGVPTEEHRPEAVMVEVQGLVERAPVSSILQSQGFRRRLENALRTSIAGRLEISPSHLRNAGARLRSTASSPAPPAANISTQGKSVFRNNFFLILAAQKFFFNLLNLLWIILLALLQISLAEPKLIGLLVLNTGVNKNWKKKPASICRFLHAVIAPSSWRI